MMVVARAKENPCRTGRETNADKRPRRAVATTSKPMPVNTTSAKLRAARSSVPGVDRDSAAAATRAAEEEVGATTAKRLAPMVA